MRIMTKVNWKKVSQRNK